MKYAVVDIGSNSVRLLVTDGERSLLRKIDVTRLSEGLNKSGYLEKDAMRRTCDAVIRFAKIAKDEGCDRFFAFATEAVRSARNGYDFVSLVKDRGVEVDVVDGDTEAKIGFAGAYTQGTVALVDVGGASTELAIGDEKGIFYSKSLPVGAMRLKDKFGENCEKLWQYCKAKVAEYGADGIPFDRLYCIGGSGSTVACVDAKLKSYDEKALHHRVLTRSRIQEILDFIASVPMEDRENIVGLDPKRKDIVVGSGIWLLCIMDYLKVNEIINSETSNTEGYLKYRLNAEMR